MPAKKPAKPKKPAPKRRAAPKPKPLSVGSMFLLRANAAISKKLGQPVTLYPTEDPRVVHGVTADGWRVEWRFSNGRTRVLRRPDDEG